MDSTETFLSPVTAAKLDTPMGTFGRIVVIRRSGEDGGAYPINSLRVSFGRDKSCSIRVRLEQVSRTHCAVSIDPVTRKILLTDTSSNGTLLNNVDICNKSAELHHGDVFSVGPRGFRFEAVDKDSITSFLKKNPSVTQHTPRTIIAHMQTTTVPTPRTSIAPMPGTCKKKTRSREVPVLEQPKKPKLFHDNENAVDPCIQSTADAKKSNESVASDAALGVDESGEVAGGVVAKAAEPDSDNQPAKKITELAPENLKEDAFEEEFVAETQIPKDMSAEELTHEDTSQSQSQAVKSQEAPTLPGKTSPQIQKTSDTDLPIRFGSEISASATPKPTHQLILVDPANPFQVSEAPSSNSTAQLSSPSEAKKSPLYSTRKASHPISKQPSTSTASSSRTNTTPRPTKRIATSSPRNGSLSLPRYLMPTASTSARQRSITTHVERRRSASINLPTPKQQPKTPVGESTPSLIDFDGPVNEPAVPLEDKAEMPNASSKNQDEAPEFVPSENSDEAKTAAVPETCFGADNVAVTTAVESEAVSEKMAESALIEDPNADAHSQGIDSDLGETTKLRFEEKCALVEPAEVAPDAIEVSQVEEKADSEQGEAGSPERDVTPSESSMDDEGPRTPSTVSQTIDALVDGSARKKVTFGPALSPEIFRKDRPASTPLKRGATDLSRTSAVPGSALLRSALRRSTPLFPTFNLPPKADSALSPIPQTPARRGKTLFGVAASTSRVGNRSANLGASSTLSLPKSAMLSKKDVTSAASGSLPVSILSSSPIKTLRDLFSAPTTGVSNFYGSSGSKFGGIANSNSSSKDSPSPLKSSETALTAIEVPATPEPSALSPTAIKEASPEASTPSSSTSSISQKKRRASFRAIVHGSGGSVVRGTPQASSPRIDTEIHSGEANENADADMEELRSPTPIGHSVASLTPTVIHVRASDTFENEDVMGLGIEYSEDQKEEEEVLAGIPSSPLATQETENAEAVDMAASGEEIVAEICDVDCLPHNQEVSTSAILTMDPENEPHEENQLDDSPEEMVVDDSTVVVRGDEKMEEPEFVECSETLDPAAVETVDENMDSEPKDLGQRNDVSLEDSILNTVHEQSMEVAPSNDSEQLVNAESAVQASTASMDEEEQEFVEALEMQTDDIIQESMKAFKNILDAEMERSAPEVQDDRNANVIEASATSASPSLMGTPQKSVQKIASLSLESPLSTAEKSKEQASADAKDANEELAVMDGESVSTGAVSEAGEPFSCFATVAASTPSRDRDQEVFADEGMEEQDGHLESVTNSGLVSPSSLAIVCASFPEDDEETVDDESASTRVGSVEATFTESGVEMISAGMQDNEQITEDLQPVAHQEEQVTEIASAADEATSSVKENQQAPENAEMTQPLEYQAVTPKRAFDAGASLGTARSKSSTSKTAKSVTRAKKGKVSKKNDDEMTGVEESPASTEHLHKEGAQSSKDSGEMDVEATPVPETAASVAKENVSLTLESEKVTPQNAAAEGMTLTAASPEHQVSANEELATALISNSIDTPPPPRKMGSRPRRVSRAKSPMYRETETNTIEDGESADLKPTAVQAQTPAKQCSEDVEAVEEKSALQQEVQGTPAIKTNPRRGVRLSTTVQVALNEQEIPAMRVGGDGVPAIEKVTLAAAKEIEHEILEKAAAVEENPKLLQENQVSSVRKAKLRRDSKKPAFPNVPLETDEEKVSESLEDGAIDGDNNDDSESPTTAKEMQQKHSSPAVETKSRRGRRASAKKDLRELEGKEVAKEVEDNKSPAFESEKNEVAVIGGPYEARANAENQLEKITAEEMAIVQEVLAVETKSRRGRRASSKRDLRELEEKEVAEEDEEDESPAIESENNKVAVNGGPDEAKANIEKQSETVTAEEMAIVQEVSPPPKTKSRRGGRLSKKVQLEQNEEDIPVANDESEIDATVAAVAEPVEIELAEDGQNDAQSEEVRDVEETADVPTASNTRTRGRGKKSTPIKTTWANAEGAENSTALKALRQSTRQEIDDGPLKPKASKRGRSKGGLESATSALSESAIMEEHSVISNPAGDEQTVEPVVIVEVSGKKRGRRSKAEQQQQEVEFAEAVVEVEAVAEETAPKKRGRKRGGQTAVAVIDLTGPEEQEGEGFKIVFTSNLSDTEEQQEPAPKKRAGRPLKKSKDAEPEVEASEPVIKKRGRGAAKVMDAVDEVVEQSKASTQSGSKRVVVDEAEDEDMLSAAAILAPRTRQRREVSEEPMFVLKSSRRVNAAVVEPESTKTTAGKKQASKRGKEAAVAVAVKDILEASEGVEVGRKTSSRRSARKV
ncbi:hypothetical protein BJ741DRAFT_632091 [Chytriomyces cf. hyalinus JEL632]|nr:hypothetical protein BJ741DRAFT_632091 [Chytriomyces cf. hyalinus JEL632]